MDQNGVSGQLFSNNIYIFRLETCNVLSVAQHSHHSGRRCSGNAFQSTKSAPDPFFLWCCMLRSKLKIPL